MKALMSMQVALQSDLITTVRLATGGVCSLVGLDLDDSEDCKVCVTESLLLVMHAGYSFARIGFEQDDGLRVRVEGEGEAGGSAAADGDEISVALLTALVGEMEIERRDGRTAAVVFRFGL